MFDLAKNIWNLELIHKCMDLMQQQSHSFISIDSPHTNNNSGSKGERMGERKELNKLKVSLCSLLRNSIERIGFILYDFDCYSIFANTLTQEIGFVQGKIEELRKLHLRDDSVSTLQDGENTESSQKQELPERANSFKVRRNMMEDIPEVGPHSLKLRNLISENMVPSQQTIKILCSFKSFSFVYLQILTRMY